MPFSANNISPRPMERDDGQGIDTRGGITLITRQAIWATPPLFHISGSRLEFFLIVLRAVTENIADRSASAVDVFLAFFENVFGALASFVNTVANILPGFFAGIVRHQERSDNSDADAGDKKEHFIARLHF